MQKYNEPDFKANPPFAIAHTEQGWVVMDSLDSVVGEFASEEKATTAAIGLNEKYPEPEAVEVTSETTEATEPEEAPSVEATTSEGAMHKHTLLPESEEMETIPYPYMKELEELQQAEEIISDLKRKLDQAQKDLDQRDEHISNLEDTFEQQDEEITKLVSINKEQFKELDSLRSENQKSNTFDPAVPNDFMDWYRTNALKTENTDYRSILIRLLGFDSAQARQNEMLIRTLCQEGSVFVQTVRSLHAILGMADEVGEIAKALKAFLFYGKQTDRINLSEESGDLSWYLNLFVDSLNTPQSGPYHTLQGSLRQNISKLQDRYKQQCFTEEQANNRDLESERNVLEDTPLNK